MLCMNISIFTTITSDEQYFLNEKAVHPYNEIFTTFLPIHKKVIPLQYDELYINANVVSM